MKKTLTVAAVAAGLILAPAAAAHADEQPGYVLVAWEVGNPDAIWETPQLYITSVLLEVPSLDALDASVPCGTYAQIDLYHANQDSAALIAGGVLYGPNNPTEPLAHGAVEGNPWKYLQTAECAVKREPRPYTDSTSTSNCEWTTTVTREGFYDLTFDAVANVWIEAGEPTITGETSSQAPVSVSELNAACSVDEQLPTLADTGPEPYDSWLYGAMGIALLGVGVALVGLVRSKRERA